MEIDNQIKKLPHTLTLARVYVSILRRIKK